MHGSARLVFIFVLVRAEKVTFVGLFGTFGTVRDPSVPPKMGFFEVWAAQEGGVTPREVLVDGNKSVAGWHMLRGGLCVEGATRRVIFRPRKSPP